MREKLYYDDSYMREFFGDVLSCTPDKKGWRVTLARTAFYPEGGGQPHDTGTFLLGDREIPVTDVRERDGKIVHYCRREIPRGSRVRGIIDWDRRFDFMQQHTGEHIFSGIAHSLFGCDNVGFHLNEKETTVDFNLPLTRENIKEIEDRCNRAVWEDKPVTAFFPEDPACLEYRSKKRLSGEIRLVKAGDSDLCACCGTHTATTGRAGPIVAPAFQNYKGGVRITLYCGRRAVDFLKRRSDDCYRISHALSAPLENITRAVNSRMAETEKLKSRVSELEKEITESLARTVPVKDGIRVAVRGDMTSSGPASLASLLLKRAEISVVMSAPRGANPRLCVAARTADTNRIGKHICENLGGKGGGKKGLFQGFTERPASPDRILKLVKETLDR